MMPPPDPLPTLRLQRLLFSVAMLAIAASGQLVASTPPEGERQPARVLQEASAAKPPLPWDAAFARFDAADAALPPAAGGVLFVGSSSIRLWSDLDQQFKHVAGVLNRGFGGSQLSDCVKHLNRLVIRYQPRAVFVYAGDNDLAAGATPEEVAYRFARFVAGVREALPAARIQYISIKPSPARARLMPKVRATNDLIRASIEGVPDTGYIDVYSAMVDAQGAPRPELFAADDLHLNARGYALWRDLISPHVH